ncbi:PAS domain-containing protein [Bdellovibrionota bacterium FG-2]
MNSDSQDRTDSEFNRSIVESLSDMLLVLNLDGTIKKVNRWVVKT